MPRPNPGESEQDYVGRFMASPEAQKDFPDEKQRAAVAYSMFREKKNTSGICPDCGSATERRAAASDSQLINETCTECGLSRHYGPDSATPPIEKLRNLCPACLHQLEPGHDEYGCGKQDCGCSESFKVIVEPRDVLPNAPPKKKTDPFGDQYEAALRAFKEVGWSGLTDEEKKIIESYENANAEIHPSKRQCPSCDFVGYPEDVVQHLTRRHGVGTDEAHDLVRAPENANAADGRSAWQQADATGRGQMLTAAGITEEHDYFVRVGFDSLPTKVQAALGEKKNSKYAVGQRASFFYSGGKSIAGSGTIKKVMPIDSGYEQEYDLDVDKTTHSMGVSKGVRRIFESELTAENANGAYASDADDCDECHHSRAQHEGGSCAAGQGKDCGCVKFRENANAQPTRTHKGCGGDLEIDAKHSGLWGDFYTCKECGAGPLGMLQIEYKRENANGFTTSEKMVMREGVTCPKCGDRGRLFVSEKTGLCDACMQEAYDKEHTNANPKYKCSECGEVATAEGPDEVIQKCPKCGGAMDYENANSWTPEFLKRNPDYKTKIEPKLAQKWDSASPEQRIKWMKQTGSHEGDAYSSFADLTSGSMGSSQAEIIMELMARLVGEKINATTNPKCPKCKGPTAWEGSGVGGSVYRCQADQCGAKVENANNLSAAGDVWAKNDRAQRCELLEQASVGPESKADLDWAQLSQMDQVQLARTLGFQNSASRFAAHCASCSPCENAGEDPAKLCGRGRGIVLANAAGSELAKKLGVKHPKDLPFDQPNAHGCNGCDAVRVPLNADGYCRDCAAEQGAFTNAEPDYNKAKLITLWAREGDAWIKKNPQMAELASFGGDGRVGPWNTQGNDIRESFAMEKGLKNDAGTAAHDVEKIEEAAAVIAEEAEEVEEKLGLENGFPASYFKRPESKDRADQVGIAEMEDEDLTPEGLKAKAAARAEAHENAHEAPEGFCVVAQYEDEKKAKEHAKLMQGAKVEKNPAGGAWRVLAKFENASPIMAGDREAAGAVAYGSRE